MTRSDFINRVLLIMNEAGMFDQAGNSYLGADTTQIDRHIEGSYVDAWRRCVKVMPRAWFKNSELPSSTIYLLPDNQGETAALVSKKTEGTGYVILPDDFYLLTIFKMKGWQKAVYEASIENEKTASIQSNEWTRGSTIRPVCTISNEAVTVKNAQQQNVTVIRQVLNYYSLPKTAENGAAHVVEKAIYVPVCKPLSDFQANGTPGEEGYTPEPDLELNDQIIEPLAYLSASTVFTMFEKYQVAEALEKRAIEMFPGLSKLKGANVTTTQ
jgi:hypothetical protein